MTILNRSRKAASAAALAGALFVSGTLATVAIAPSVGAAPSQAQTSTSAGQPDEALFTWLCHLYGKC